MGQIINSTTTVGNTIYVNPNAGPTGLSPLGGAQRFPDKRYSWFKRDNATSDYKTRRIVLAAGQVLKRGTWLQSTPQGTMIAHGAFLQNSTVLLSGTGMSAGDTLKIGNITYTAAQSLTPLQVAQAWRAYSVNNTEGYPASSAAQNTASLAALAPTLGSFSAWVPGWNYTIDENSIQQYALGTPTTGTAGLAANTVVGIALIAQSSSYISAVGAFANAVYTAASTSTLTVNTFYDSIPGQATIQATGSLTSTQTAVIGGITFTAAVGGATAAQVLSAISLIPSGALSTASTLTNGLVTVTASTGAVTLNATSASLGTLTGTNAGWTFQIGFGSSVLTAISTPVNSTNGILSASGNLTFNVGQSNTVATVAGLLLMDTNASTGAVTTQMFIDGDFWAEGIQWDNHPLPSTVNVPIPGGAGYTGQNNGYDYVVNGDGTVTACTPYWTGVNTLLDAQKFLENTAGNTFFTLGSWQSKAGEIEP
ncbi:MAG: hypothetical protein NTV98_05975 [Candidatus Roizmanbacteria bacterium]|nr:hypothetical protein [Candidatus Roizmanbacteria bacterium]